MLKRICHTDLGADVSLALNELWSCVCWTATTRQQFKTQTTLINSKIQNF